MKIVYRVISVGRGFKNWPDVDGVYSKFLNFWKFRGESLKSVAGGT